MTEQEYAQMDNLIMDEVNVKSVSYLFMNTDKGELRIVLNKGDSKYYIELDGVALLETTMDRIREKGLIDTYLEKRISVV